MGKEAKDLEKLLISNKPVMCEKCKGKLFYKGGGRYECGSCDYSVLDDFGKVKEFLELNGPTPMLLISQATGVEYEIIERFLKKGRLEIPEGSKYFLNCEKCGCSIRYGKYCPDCIKHVATGIKAVFHEDVGEKPKRTYNAEMTGKMHYLKHKKDKK